MPTLKESPTLRDFQSYVATLEHERGFASQDVLKKCLLLGEEMGELFKAIRGQQLMSIDLEQAFRRKEQVNKCRTWTRDASCGQLNWNL